LPQVAGKGGVLLAGKVSLGIIAALVVGHFLGTEPVKTGLLAGLSTLAVVAAINDTNGGLYMALMGRYGTPQEMGAYSVTSLESGSDSVVRMVSRGLYNTNSRVSKYGPIGR
jgi:2-keto-3-deoxygluconate permease